MGYSNISTALSIQPCTRLSWHSFFYLQISVQATEYLKFEARFLRLLLKQRLNYKGYSLCYYTPLVLTSFLFCGRGDFKPVDQ